MHMYIPGSRSMMVDSRPCMNQGSGTYFAAHLWISGGERKGDLMDRENGASLVDGMYFDWLMAEGARYSRTGRTDQDQEAHNPEPKSRKVTRRGTGDSWGRTRFRWSMVDGSSRGCADREARFVVQESWTEEGEPSMWVSSIQLGWS